MAAGSLGETMAGAAGPPGIQGASLNALMARPDQFVQTLTVKLMTYALGRGVEAHDMPTVRAIVRNAAAQDYKFSSIVSGIVKSDPFMKQMVPTAPAGADLKTAEASLH